MIRTLLICDDLPSYSYGTGQRLIAHRIALSKLGECRLLHLTNNARPYDLDKRDFVASLPFDHRSSRLAWLYRMITFAACRRDRRYIRILADIRKLFPYDLVFCSFFRTTCVAPTATVPCMVDIDAIPPATGTVARLLWPITKLAMRKRTRAFRAVYVIRKSDELIFKAGEDSHVAVLPGISATACKHQTTVQRMDRVLLVGSVHWKPNRDAINWLLSLSIPNVLRDIGHELRVVGSGTERIRAKPGLSCAGFVDNISVEYGYAKLVICPIFSGGGANIKLAEAVQFGCPVLSSAHAAVGYDGILAPGVHIEVFTEEEDFVQTFKASARPRSSGSTARKGQRGEQKCIKSGVLQRSYCARCQQDLWLHLLAIGVRGTSRKWCTHPVAVLFKAR